MTDAEEMLERLRRDGVVTAPDARITPLTGGVSSEIYLVEAAAEKFVVKRALAKLKVHADWYADVSRNRHEWEYIAYVAGFLPGAVPALRFCSATGGYFVMEHLGGEFANWKQLLLAGHGDVAQARQAGGLLAGIHKHSFGDGAARRLFDTSKNFYELRLEPYLIATGKKHPALQAFFADEAARLAGTRECLVHGDFSPKNILLSPERMVVLDCEVAWYGDPAFDTAFLLNHFCLKALYHAPRATVLKPMVESFWKAYQAVRPSSELDARTGRLLLLLLLARVDGKSPAEYLDAGRQDLVRAFVREQLPAGDLSLNAVADAWFARLASFKA
jgi:aminoglycoside phosphotransferase (APT) family kinase protein